MPADVPIDTAALLEVVNHLNLGVYVTDRTRRILLWNTKAEQITGHRAEDVVGTACWDGILQHLDKHGHQLCKTKLCPLFRAMETGTESRRPILVYAKKADGSRVAVSVSTAPLRDAAGNVVGGIETFRDETANVIDMEFAAKIQRHLFPRRLPQPSPMRFDAQYYPHDLIGGDFYDVLELADDTCGVLLADVRGHGVSAALYTMWLKNLENEFRSRAHDPVAMVTAMNRSLAAFAVEESFATAVYGVLDASSAEFAYCNAGHPPPILYHASTGTLSELESHGMPLGIISDETYASSTAHLAPGDILFFYTDGMTDVTDAEGAMLNPQRLGEIFLSEIPRGFDGLLDRIYTRVVDISADVSLTDDCTMLTITRGA